MNMIPCAQGLAQEQPYFHARGPPHDMFWDQGVCPACWVLPVPAACLPLLHVHDQLLGSSLSRAKWCKWSVGPLRLQPCCPSCESCSAANYRNRQLCCLQHPPHFQRSKAGLHAGPFDAAAEARACRDKFNVTPDRDWSILNYGTSQRCWRWQPAGACQQQAGKAPQSALSVRCMHRWQRRAEPVQHSLLLRGLRSLAARCACAPDFRAARPPCCMRLHQDLACSTSCVKPWSSQRSCAGSIQHNVSDTVTAIFIPEGAHHLVRPTGLAITATSMLVLPALLTGSLRAGPDVQPP